MANILLVDDDKNHLNAMWRVLWLDGQHETERFTSPNEALERAKLQSFDVVITDYRMPEMDGAKFLHAFRALQPNSCRILISGNADMGLFRSAMKDLRVHHLLEKPCDSFQLMRAVQEGLEQIAVAKELQQIKMEYEQLQQKYQKLQQVVNDHAPQLLQYLE